METMLKRGFAVILAVVLCFGVMPISVFASNAYYINGATVRNDDFSSSPNECWDYANNVYNKIWGQRFSSVFNDSNNSLRNLSDSELTLTAEHLKAYVTHAALGSSLRICNSSYLHGNDGCGHSQIIVQKDSNGFTVFEGGLSSSPYRREKYYTWSEYTGWLGGTYAYIKYIKWPGAQAYTGKQGSVVFHSSAVKNVTSNDATISTWTTNKNGEFFSCGFWIGQSSDTMRLFTTYAHWGWTEFYGEYKISDYYGQLSPGTTYYYRYYLISAVDMSYYQSDIMTFTTPGISKVVFAFPETRDVSAISANICSWTWNKKGYTMYSHGFCIGESANNMEKIKLYSNIGWTDFYTSISISDYKILKPNTTYYYRFYAYVDSYYYSELYSFETNATYPTYDITFDYQEGFSDSARTVSVTYGGFPPSVKVPQREGYSFDGYYAQPNGKGTQYYSSYGEGVHKWNVAKDTSLYANWIKNEHIHSYSVTCTDATCTEKGYRTYVCKCGYSYIDDYVDEKGHYDENQDGKCDVCECELYTNCQCACHKNGFIKFFFNFILIFQKLFGQNKMCVCGEMHY